MSYPRDLFIAVFAVAAATVVASCGDGATGPDPSDAIASVVVTPAADSVDIGASIQLQATVRNGRGETVSASTIWSTSDASVATVSQSGLVTGVAEGEADISASAGGFSESASVTVLHPRNEVIAAARAAYVNSVANGFFVLALATEEPLPAGTQIRKTPASAGFGPEIVLQRDAFLVVVDLVPTAGLPHPFAYLLVDALDRSVTVESAFLPPEVDGVGLYTTFEERLLSDDRFEPEVLQDPLDPVRDLVFEFNEDPFSGQAATAPSMVPGAQPGLNAGVSANPVQPAGSANGRRVAVVVGSGRDGFITNTAGAATSFFNDNGFETTRIDSKDFTLGEAQTTIRSVSQGLGSGDKFVLYIISHSWIDDDDDDGILDAPPTRIAYDLRGSNEAGWGVATTSPGSVADLLDDLPAERVNFFIESCGAGGSLVRYLPMPVIGEPFEPHLGTTFQLYSGAAYDRSCYFSLTSNSPELSVGRYTDFLTSYFDEHPLDANDDGELGLDEIEMGFGAAHQDATTAFATSSFFDQMPPAVATFSSPLFSVTGPSEIEFSNVLGVTPCPQPIGSTITITNPTDVPLQWSTSETVGPFTRILAAPFFGTLQPGESVEVELTFRCNYDESFVTGLRFGFTTGSPGTQGSFTIPITATIDATPGTLTITSSTSGDDLVDEYVVEDVRTGEPIGTIGPNETKQFPGVPPGFFMIRLRPMRGGEPATNCIFNGGFIRDVTIPAGDEGKMGFDAQCFSLGSSDDVLPESGVGNVKLNSDNVAGGAFSVLVNDPPGSSIASDEVTSSNGGSVSIDSDGTFAYDPPPGFDGLDGFTYTIDLPGGGSEQPTVSILVADMIWFIDNSVEDGGDGRFSGPFKGLDDFQGSGASATGDNIFIYGSETDYQGPLTLLDGQTVVGSGGDFEAATGIALPSSSLFQPADLPADPPARISGEGITLSQNNTIRGLTIGNTSGTGIAGSGVGTLTVRDVAITGTGAAVDITSGNLDVTLESIESNGSAGAGINLSSVTGSFEVTGPTSITNPSGDGIEIAGNSSGTFTFADVDIDAPGGDGINVDALAGGSVSFASIGVNDGGDAGISLNSLAGNFEVTGSTSITNPSGDGIEIAGNSSGTFTFGDLDVTSPAQAGLNLTLTGSGTFNITGSATITNSSAAGIDLTGGSSTTFNFDAIEIDNSGTPGAGLMATDAGTLNITGPGSMIRTGAGTALSASGANLGVTLESVSSSGSGQGISLSNTMGSFTVTGTGNPGSGGTILNAGESGVSLTDVQNVSLNELTIDGSAQGVGITFSGSAPLDPTIMIQNGTITNTAGRGIDISSSPPPGWNGEMSFTGNTVDGTGAEGIRLDQMGGSTPGLLFSSSTFVINNNNILNSGSSAGVSLNLSGRTYACFDANGNTLDGSFDGLTIDNALITAAPLDEAALSAANGNVQVNTTGNTVFNVPCPPPSLEGSLEVSNTIDLLPGALNPIQVDISLDLGVSGQERLTTAEPNGSVNFGDVPIGLHTLRASAANCTFANSPLPGYVVPGSTTDLQFVGTCSPAPAVQIGYLSDPCCGGDPSVVRTEVDPPFTQLGRFDLGDVIPVFAAGTSNNNSLVVLFDPFSGEWDLDQYDGDGNVIRNIIDGETDPIEIGGSGCNATSCVFTLFPSGGSPTVYKVNPSTGLLELVTAGQSATVFDRSAGETHLYVDPLGQIVQRPVASGTPTVLSGQEPGFAVVGLSVCPNGHVIATETPDGDPGVQNIVEYRSNLDENDLGTRTVLTDDGLSNAGFCVEGSNPDAGTGPRVVFNNSSGFSFKVQELQPDGSVDDVAFVSGEANFGAFSFLDSQLPSLVAPRASGSQSPALADPAWSARQRMRVQLIQELWRQVPVHR